MTKICAIAVLCFCLASCAIQAKPKNPGVYDCVSQVQGSPAYSFNSEDTSTVILYSGDRSTVTFKDLGTHTLVTLTKTSGYLCSMRVK